MVLSLENYFFLRRIGEENIVNFWFLIDLVLMS